ncbi:hypothetical protein ABK040_010393 [Willaertia magna]
MFRNQSSSGNSKDSSNQQINKPNYIELLSKLKKYLYEEKVTEHNIDEFIEQGGITEHYIKLEHKGYTSIPDFILESKALRSELEILILSHNRITSIPPDITQLEALKILDLSHNKFIKNFTYDLLNLKHLIGLNLSYNSIRKIPDQFFNKFKQQMMVLQLNNNLLQNVDNGDWSNFKNSLIELQLADNNLIEIPDSICELQNLTNLNLSGNYLENLPKKFYLLKNLKTLLLQRNNLKKLNKFEGTDYTIFYTMKNLINFDISNNKLNENDLIGLDELNNLQNIKFRTNKFKKFPEINKTFLNLKKIDLSNNKIIKFPIDISLHLGNLIEELNISNNQIEILPIEFQHFIKLKVLNISKNNLIELPSYIGNCNNLQILKANNNFIKNIHSKCFNKNLNKLYEIDLDFNFLKTIPKTICELNELIILRIENNELEYLPNEISYCKHLKGLYLSKNKLKYLPETIGELKEIRKIHVEYNCLINLPNSLKYCCKTLEIFNCNYNTKELHEFINLQKELDQEEREKLFNEYKEKYEKWLKINKSSLLEKLKNTVNKNNLPFLSDEEVALELQPSNNNNSEASSSVGSSSKQQSEEKENKSSLTSPRALQTITATAPHNSGKEMMNSVKNDRSVGQASNIIHPSSSLPLILKEDKEVDISSTNNNNIKTPEEFIEEQYFLTDLFKLKKKEIIQCRQQ